MATNETFVVRSSTHDHVNAVLTVPLTEWQSVRGFHVPGSEEHALLTAKIKKALSGELNVSDFLELKVMFDSANDDFDVKGTYCADEEEVSFEGYVQPVMSY